MKTFTLVMAGLLCSAADEARSEESAKPPLRLGIVGLVHDHAHAFIPGARSRPDIQLVGIAEPNAELAAKYAARYKLNTNLFYTSLEEMLDKAKPQAVA